MKVNILRFALVATLIYATPANAMHRAAATLRRALPALSTIKPTHSYKHPGTSSHAPSWASAAAAAALLSGTVAAYTDPRDVFHDEIKYLEKSASDRQARWNKYLWNAYMKEWSDPECAKIAKALSEIPEEYRKAAIDSQDEYGTTLLDRAIWYHHKALAQLLLENGAYINNAGSLLKEAHLLYLSQDETSTDRIAFIKLFLKHGADPLVTNMFKETPLHLVLKDGFNDCAFVLLQASIEALESQGKNVTDFVNAKTSAGHTPLCFAAAHGDDFIVQQLLNAGASPHGSFFAPGALDNAVEHHNEAVIPLLLAAGAHVTLWHLAEADNYFSKETIELLNEHYHAAYNQPSES